MRIIVQKTTKATVYQDNQIVTKINKGLVLLVGFTITDTKDEIDYLINKIINLRIFEDNNDIMNLSILDVGGEILSLSQFTLYADTKKGNRPSYVKAMKNDQAKIMWDLFNKELATKVSLQKGIFGADLQIELINDGPTTIMLEKEQI